MAKLLVVQESIIVGSLFKKLLNLRNDFEYDLVNTYDEAKVLLGKSRYEFAVVERILSDAPNGEIIALFNKHNIAPLVFTKDVDEDFFESFEGAQIVDYVLKQKYNGVPTVIEKLKQLRANKNITVLVVSESKIYLRYLKQNLNLHNFKVFTALNAEEAYEKIELHPETSLMVLDTHDNAKNELEIVSMIRGKNIAHELKILTLVDETNSYVTSSLLNHGADDFLVKQFSRDEFYVRIYQNINKIR